VDPAFVLVHSLLLGPLTWAPVAAELAASDVATVVPSLVDVTAVDDPPYWPRVVDKVNDSVRRLPPGQPVVVVAHSNAGLFVPVITEAAARPVAGLLFVDARLPALAGATAAASPERLDHLRTSVVGGRLPQWTAWWNQDEVARLFPDPQTQAAVSAEQPRLPLSYYQQQVPVPVGWCDRPCGYLLFGQPYDRMAQDAREGGWDVDQISGGHLHQLVDPAGVTARIIAMTRKWFSPER
jgi:hypothetical protein